MKIYGNLESNMKVVGGVDQLRAIEVCERGDTELEIRVLQMDAIFDHIQTLLRDRVEDKAQNETIDRINVPRWLRVDPTRLRQAVLNYTVNAFK